MSNETLTCLKRLSDDELISQLKTLVARERGATALLIAHLAELDTRDVFLRQGYASLFAYCREALELSDHEAFNRIEAARAARRFPVILEMLAAGAVNLTAVRLLAPHLTAENHRRVLEGARGKNTEQIREVVAHLSPKPDVGTSVRRIAAPSVAVQPGAPSGLASSPASSALAPLLASAPRPAPAAAVLPLAPDRYKLQLALLTDLARKKFAATERPRASKGSTPGSRDIPADVRRAVWVRDLGRCAFVGTGGHRCTERGFVEFHHVRPYEVGGEPTVGNIQLRCGRHNRYEARVYFKREDRHGEGVLREAGPVYGQVARVADVNSF